ncbi:FAD-binding PCMH-type domain-containing protein [Haematococcus lacustris]|uniref:FAD-binding PCMH-type domain-containing protein n=1 Tax=Haematococcus lacustris TaxID=44745 RepID=A0A699YPF9_HAELA|nr:FAD-binding PCMH-type domain-containing protein [Haematococcus lacustris]
MERQAVSSGPGPTVSVGTVTEAEAAYPCTAASPLGCAWPDWPDTHTLMHGDWRQHGHAQGAVPVQGAVELHSATPSWGPVHAGPHALLARQLLRFLSSGQEQGNYAAYWSYSALTLHSQLCPAPQAHSPPTSSGHAGWQAHLLGTGLMTIKWDEQFKGIQLLDKLLGLPANPWHGKIGFAQLPGSPTILNRSTGKLEACTTTTCPHATLQRNQFTGETSLVNTAPNFGIAGFSGAKMLPPSPLPCPSLASSALKPLPYSALCPSGYAGMINAHQGAGYKQATFNFFSFIAQLNRSMVHVIGNSPVGPFLTQHLSTAPSALARWQAAGYHPPDVVTFLDNMDKSLTHPNGALDIRITNGRLYREAFSTGLAMFQNGSTAADIMVWMNAQFIAQLAKDGGRMQVST